MAKTESELYKFHVENLRSLEIAMKNTADACKREISQEKENAVC